MSSLISKRPPIQGVRRVEYADVPAIENLVTKIAKDYFNGCLVKRTIEHCFLSLCAYNTHNEIVAAMSFQNNPNVPAIPPWDWLPWIKNIYKMENLSIRSTLFVHLMVWDPRYKSEFIQQILLTAFILVFYIRHIILVAPPGVPALFFIEEHFTRVLPEGYSDIKKVQTLYITLRQTFVEGFKIRRAVEEDNDDIVPLIHQHATQLKEWYGDYYISEIIRSQENPKILCSKERQIIIAESRENAIGVLCLTTKIAYNVLNDSFELAPFHGLRKPSSSDIFKETLLERGVLEQQEEDEEFKFVRSDIRSIKTVPPTQPLPHKNSEESIEENNIIIYDENYPENNNSIDNISFIESIPSYDFETQNSSQNNLRLSSNSEQIDIEEKDDTFLADKDDTSEERTSTNLNLPKFLGEENAFAIELFTAVNEKEYSAAINLIEAAFECFPDRDYCILSVPSTYPPWPLLQLFARAAPRPYSTYPHELYILHRNGILSELEVREGKPEDVTAIRNLVYGIRKDLQIFNDFVTSVISPNTEFKSYVLTTESCIVGCIIIREEDDSEYLSSHFVLNEYVKLELYPIGSFGSIVHGVVSPIFQIHKRFFLREVLRLSDLQFLHYRLYSDSSSDRTLANIVAEMIAIEPRLRPEYHPNPEVDGDVPRDFVLRQDPPYTLYAINLRHCSIPKMDINRKLVVVGSSTTGLAFLENMVFGRTASYISFPNITLVSKQGFNHQKIPEKIRNIFVPFEGRYNYRHMKQATINCYVNYIKGSMTDINRKDKFITIDNKYIVPYDYLFLTCGEQYHRPNCTATSYKSPANVFIVNTEVDAEYALQYLQSNVVNKSSYTILVYGATLETYCCLAALREFGIPGANIIFVEPFPNPDESENISLFNDGEVDDAIANAIFNEGIVTYSSYYFREWKLNKDKLVRSVVFESKFKLLEIECAGFFYYESKTVCPITVSAIVRAGGLVYDGRLVIDNLFQTKDPNIFSAGSLTKYSRRYYAEDLSQKYFNHIEVGARLAMYTKRNLDPTYVKKEESAAEVYLRKVLTPVFTQPLVKYCSLPGGYNYLHISKPGKPVSIEAQMNKEDYGRVFITGDLKYSKQGYFRLHLNQNNIVETITCLTKDNIDIQNTIKLWGKHEQLLNNLVQRFEMVLITDFFEYFRQPWIYAIFHESFMYKVGNYNSRLLKGLTSDADDQILKHVIETFEKNNWDELTQDQRSEMIQLFEKSTHKEKMEENLLNFLIMYHMHMPVYAHPLEVKLLLAGYDNSPLHFPQ